jgi:hypothetical protein
MYGAFNQPPNNVAFMTSGGGTVRGRGSIRLSNHDMVEAATHRTVFNGYPVNYPPGETYSDIEMSNGKVRINGEEYTVIDGEWRAPGYRRVGTMVGEKRAHDTVSVTTDDDVETKFKKRVEALHSWRVRRGAVKLDIERKPAHLEERRIQREAEVQRASAIARAEMARLEAENKQQEDEMARYVERGQTQANLDAVAQLATIEAFSLLMLEGNSEKSEVDGMQCAMCLEHKKNVLLKPCRHVCLCVECARSLHDKPACPVCRGVITGAEVVFI